MFNLEKEELRKLSDELYSDISRIIIRYNLYHMKQYIKVSVTNVGVNVYVIFCFHIWNYRYYASSIEEINRWFDNWIWEVNQHFREHWWTYL